MRGFWFWFWFWFWSTRLCPSWRQQLCLTSVKGRGSGSTRGVHAHTRLGECGRGGGWGVGSAFTLTEVGTRHCQCGIRRRARAITHSHTLQQLPVEVLSLSRAYNAAFVRAHKSPVACESYCLAATNVFDATVCMYSQALFGGQPMLIVGVAEPIILIYAFVFSFCDDEDIPFRAFTCVMLLWYVPSGER